MASTIYCSKSGSDSNNGSTYVLSKLTIQASITAAAIGGTVIVGSGLYNETIAPTVTTLYADGVVILDGTGLAFPPIYNLSNTYYQLTIAPYTTGGQWVIINSTQPYLMYMNAPAQPMYLALSNVFFIGSSTSYGIYLNRNQGNVNGMQLYGTIKNCAFSNLTTGIYSTFYEAAYSTFYSINIINNTFYNCTTAILFGSSSGSSTFSGTIIQNIFSNGTTAIRDTAAMTSPIINYNDYYGYTNLLNNAGTLYTTLASVQALGYESQGITTNPAFVDAANNVLIPTVNLNTTNNNYLYYGAYPFGLTRGNSYNPDNTWNIIAAAGHDNSGWYNPDGNVTMVSNLFQLTSGTVGVIWSPVYDLGTAKTISQFNIDALQVWGTSMADTTKTDVRPNYQTAEIRTSATTFLQNDGVIAWTELKNKIPFTTQGSTNMAGRYIQLRITLRSDDTAA